jgi:parallel beta-helix repeat protein
LNGFVITGDNGSLTSCKASTNQTAIDTAGYSNAQIHGPGLITRFTGNGVIVSGSNSEVHQVVITGVCFNGIVVGNNIPADGYNHVHQNSISLFALPPNGANGIAVLGTGNNQIEQNVITGGGANGYGIILVTSSDSNRIQQNNFSGNAAGIVVYSNSLSNIIQENQVLGNTLLDIFDPNSVHSNTYNDNLCQVSSGPGAPVCPGTIPAAVIGNQ